MTNRERQKWLDKKKWLKSEKAGRDLSGNMDYCLSCKKQGVQFDDENMGFFICESTQEEREKDNLCAKAYNKLYR